MGVKMPLFYGYTRVSTSNQTTKNQRNEIFEYAHVKNILIDKIIEVEVSTSKNKNIRQIDETLNQLNAYFTLFFHLFHSKPSTFLSPKQASEIVA